MAACWGGSRPGRRAPARLSQSSSPSAGGIAAGALHGGGPVRCLPRQLCLRCRLLISQQLSRKPCPPSLPPLADKTGAFCSSFGGSKACGKERGASAALGCKVLLAPGAAGREGEGAGTGGRRWRRIKGEAEKRERRKAGVDGVGETQLHPCRVPVPS